MVKNVYVKIPIVRREPDSVGTVLVVMERYVRPGEPSPCTPMYKTGATGSELNLSPGKTIGR
jgi:hypothetical protein